MEVVVNLRQHRNRGLVATLKELTQLAEQGLIHGHAFVIKMGPHDHRAGLSGDYKDHPSEGMAAAVLLNEHLSVSTKIEFEHSG